MSLVGGFVSFVAHLWADPKCKQKSNGLLLKFLHRRSEQADALQVNWRDRVLHEGDELCVRKLHKETRKKHA